MAAFALYSSNMNLPLFDFRPFKEGTDVRIIKEKEEQAMSEIEVLGYELKNTITGETKEVMMDEFMKDFKKYPKSDWEYTQIKTEPSMEPTKISDFVITGIDNSDMSARMLQDPEYNLWVISPVLTPSGTETATRSIVRTDTLLMESDTGTRTIISQVPVDQEYEDIIWAENVLERYHKKVLPAEKAMAEKGYETYIAIGGAGQEAVLDLNEELGNTLYMGTADAILLKTIIRSNPGFLLVKDGVILRKWHYNKFSVEDLLQTIQSNQ